MNHATAAERRSFLTQGALLSIGALLCQPADSALAAEHDGQGQSLEVPPTEDLMRERGVLDRVLLIYDEILWRRLLQGEEFPPEVLAKAAGIVRRFIEDYRPT